MDKNAKKIKAEKVKAEEAVLNRILCWVVGGAVLEFLLLLLNRYWNHYTAAQIPLRQSLGTAVKVLAVVALVCTVAAGFWWNTARRKGKKTGVPATLAIFLLGVSVSCFAAWFFSGSGVKLMYIAVPVVIVLALVYYLYQHEFFLTACESALVLLGVWVFDKGAGGALRYVYAAVVLLLILLGVLLCRKAQGSRGKVEFRDKKLRVFSNDANYALLYAGAAILALVLVLAVAGVMPVVLYAVTVAWILVMAVYYTVKLM